jgi:aspartyl/asparaginyl beta-hydroxylase (cupin superfamily)
MNEPEFWEDRLSTDPICNQFIKHWRAIRIEVLFVKFLFPNFFGNYPKFRVIDPETEKKVRIYENSWKLCPISKFDNNHSLEMNSIIKRLKNKIDLQSLIQRNRKWIGPRTHSIIEGPERDGIISNVFISVLSPGTIIRPHKGYSKEYMRIHLGLICDPECKITVGEKTKTWEPGKILAFKDGGPYYHSVVHNGTKDRYILSFDIKLDYLANYIN